MSQYLPTGNFENLVNTFHEDYSLPEVQEDILHIPDDNDKGFFYRMRPRIPCHINLTTENLR